MNWDSLVVRTQQSKETWWVLHNIPSLKAALAEVPIFESNGQAPSPPDTFFKFLAAELKVACLSSQ